MAAIVVVVLLGWFGLDRAFRGWTARYQALARFGATEVAPAVDPLAALDFSDVPREEWQAAVRDTHAMLVALTGAGVLDQGQMDALRRHLNQQVAGATAHPSQARAILTRIWDEIERDAGPAIAPDLVPLPPNSRHARRHPRPARPPLLGPSRPSR